MSSSTNIPDESLLAVDESTELLLAEAVDEFTNRLHRGESAGVIADDLCKRFPALTSLIQDLVPTLTGLATIGRDDRYHPNYPFPMDAPEGERRLGGYRLIRRIGQGGMGVVYEAEDESLRRRVALKVLRQHAALDSRCIQRFKVEAQAASCLSHPHIVPVYAVGQADDTSYYTMPLIDGMSLDRVIELLKTRAGCQSSSNAEVSQVELNSGLVRALLLGKFLAEEPDSEPMVEPMGAEHRSGSTLPINNRAGTIGQSSYIRCVAALGVQVADALQHAHETGILHRDIKPGNLLLNQRGNLWITDFGLARLPDSSYAMTDSGERPGTLRYMSPEQAAGDTARVDRRTDIYALGASLYEMLTLEPAVRGSDPQALLRQIFEVDVVSPQHFNPAIPHDLSNIISKCLCKDPAHRYDTSRELADDLRRFLAGEPVNARPLNWGLRLLAWSRRNPTIAVLATLLVGAIISGFTGVTLAWRQAVRERDEKEIAKRESSNALVDAKISHEKSTRALGEVDTFARFLRSHFLMTSEPFTHQFDAKFSLKEALEQAAIAIEPTFRKSPALMVDIDKDFAQAFHDLGSFNRSSFHINRALKTLEDVSQSLDEPSFLNLPDGRSDLPGLSAKVVHLEPKLNLKIMLGHNLFHQGMLEQSEQTLREALQELSNLKEPETSRHLLCKKYLSETLMARGDTQESRIIQEELLGEIARSQDFDSSSRIPIETDITLRLADLDFVSGKTTEAIEKVQNLGTKLSEISPVPIKSLLNSQNNLGGLLQRVGRLEEAEEIFRNSIEANLTIYGENDYRTLLIHENLAKVLMKAHKNADEAESILRDLVSKRMNLLGPDDLTTYSSQILLSQALFENGKVEEAIDIIEKTLERQRIHLGEENPETQKTRKIFESIRHLRQSYIQQ